MVSVGNTVYKSWAFGAGGSPVEIPAGSLYKTTYYLLVNALQYSYGIIRGDAI